MSGGRFKTPTELMPSQYRANVNDGVCAELRGKVLLLNDSAELNIMEGTIAS